MPGIRSAIPLLLDPKSSGNGVWASLEVKVDFGIVDGPTESYGDGLLVYIPHS
jgi:hypothetical protein